MKRPASEVQVGDRVRFPGRRQGKEVEITEVVHESETVTLKAEGVQWMVAQDWEVEVAEDSE